MPPTLCMHPSTLSPIPFLLPQPSPAPYLLLPPGRSCRQARAGATPSWLGREQSIWCGAAGRGPRARGGPDPVPFPARLLLGASPLTYTRLCYVGEAPSSHFIPSLQPPPGVFVQRSGAVGLAGEGARLLRPFLLQRGLPPSQELGNLLGTEAAGGWPGA